MEQTRREEEIITTFNEKEFDRIFQQLYRAKRDSEKEHGAVKHDMHSRVYVDISTQSLKSLTGKTQTIEPFEKQEGIPPSVRRFFGNRQYSVFIEKKEEGILLTVNINNMPNAEFINFRRSGGAQVIRRISFNSASLLIREHGEYIINLTDQENNLLESFDMFIEI